MGLVLDPFDFAAPREAHTRAARDGSTKGIRRPALPTRRRDGLLSVASLRRAFFASRPAPVAEHCTQRDVDALTYPTQMEALGRVVARVAESHR